MVAPGLRSAGKGSAEPGGRTTSQPFPLSNFDAALARHIRTGEALLPDLRDRLIAADTADAGFAAVEYLESALVDLAFHRGSPPADPMARQAGVLAALDAPAAIPMRHATPQFQHVFAGDGYSAGYYSYLWSEVMDADAFAASSEPAIPSTPKRPRGWRPRSSRAADRRPRTDCG